MEAKSINKGIIIILYLAHYNSYTAIDKLRETIGVMHTCSYNCQNKLLKKVNVVLNIKFSFCFFVSPHVHKPDYQ